MHRHRIPDAHRVLNAHRGHDGDASGTFLKVELITTGTLAILWRRRRHHQKTFQYPLKRLSSIAVPLASPHHLRRYGNEA